LESFFSDLLKLFQSVLLFFYKNYIEMEFYQMHHSSVGGQIINITTKTAWNGAAFIIREPRA